MAKGLFNPQKKKFIVKNKIIFIIYVMKFLFVYVLVTSDGAKECLGGHLDLLKFC